MIEHNFIGTWKLVYWKNTDEKGVVSYPFGEKAQGFISYTPDGYIFAVLTKDGRQPCFSNDPLGVSETEKISSYDSYFSYCGKFEIKGQTVIHHIQSCSFSNWNGAGQLRHYTFTDNALILSTQPFMINGSVQVSELYWEKE